MYVRVAIFINDATADYVASDMDLNLQLTICKYKIAFKKSSRDFDALLTYISLVCIRKYKKMYNGISHTVMMSYIGRLHCQTM